METTSENGANKTPSKTLPYISYATFSNALDSIVESGLPPQIDRSVLTQFSGANQNLILTTFRFMGLTDEKDKPTKEFMEYEKADQEKRKIVIGLLVKDRYPTHVRILANGTYQLLKESFDTKEVPASVRAKALSFFIGIARATGYNISAHIIKGMNARTVRRDAGSKKRTKVSEPGDVELYEDDVDIELTEGMVRVPISVGIGRTWYAIVSEDYTSEDVEKFVQIVKITLGDGKKK
jgi:hypothetical protein